MKKYFLLFFALFYFGIGDAQFKVLHSFNDTTGGRPFGSLTLSGNKLYGMTTEGGKKNMGCVFSIDTNGSNYKVLLNFNDTNGESPQFGTLMLANGVFYGMTTLGGPYSGGNIFSVDTNGANCQDMHDFGASGSNPTSSLTISGNKLYGMTPYGGSYYDGNIFSINTNGNGYKDLFDFSGANGEYPYGALTLIGNKLYGGATDGGATGDGNIFSIDTNGIGYKDLFDFNGTNGKNPCYGTALTFSEGVLYGVAATGGAHDSGSIFSIDTNGTRFKDMLDFTGISAPYYGTSPSGTLMLIGSNLYGVTSYGGTNGGQVGGGCIFSIDTNGTGYNDMFNFNDTNELAPYGSLTIAGNMFYGMTSCNGGTRYGLIFSFNTTNIPTSINSFSPSPGFLKMFPNPNNGIFNIQFQKTSARTQIEIYDILGERINNFSINGQENIVKVDMRDEPNGIYLYRAVSESGAVLGSGKFVIAK